MAQQYLLNIKNGTLHIFNTHSCYFSKNINRSDTNLKFYNNEDSAIAENQNYIKRCKNCFKNR